MTYAEKLKSPKWQKRRLEILDRDCFKCRQCGDAESSLQVHHIQYKFGLDPWEYPPDDLQTLCEKCHGEVTASTKEAKALFTKWLRTSPAYVVGHLKWLEFTLSLNASGVTLHDPEEARGFVMCAADWTGGGLNAFSIAGGGVSYLVQNGPIKVTWDSLAAFLDKCRETNEADFEEYAAEMDRRYAAVTKGDAV
jgi:hypothetical protein